MSSPMVWSLRLESASHSKIPEPALATCSAHRSAVVVLTKSLRLMLISSPRSSAMLSAALESSGARAMTKASSPMERWRRIGSGAVFESCLEWFCPSRRPVTQFQERAQPSMFQIRSIAECPSSVQSCLSPFSAPAKTHDQRCR